MKMRLEKDCIGEKNVPADALYGVQSLRARENFDITGVSFQEEMIVSLALLKKACAMANKEAGVIEPRIADAIIASCEDIMEGKYHDQFIVDMLAGSAGTSMNMNANEVIANVAILHLGGKPGDYSLVHPNDHVNHSQSTNDIIPTAGKMAVLALLDRLEKSLNELYESLVRKGEEFDGILKMGRTHLQDAVPVRLGQEFNAYSSAVARSMRRFRDCKKEMLSVNMGGTAIGTGLNANEIYYDNIVPILAELTRKNFVQAEDMIDGTQHIDSFSAVSSVVKDCALSLSKIAGDLRLMASGPRAGFGEINLPAHLEGSAIMPEKVNPIIPQIVNQVAFRIVGNDVTISMGVQAGQLELNAFEPVVLNTLFQSITLLDRAVQTFNENCVAGITANPKRCEELLSQSVGVVTALCPYIGHDNASLVAREALHTGDSVREVLLRKKLLSEEEADRILDFYNMTIPSAARL